MDSSTQSTKVVLCRADDGAIAGAASAPHPDGTECDPKHWWQALGPPGEGLLEQASAIGVAAQQHGMIALDDAGEVIRPAILWNDMRAAPQTRDLIAELGGPAEWARRTGSVPAVSFTVTKLRWMAEREPESARRLHRVVLPHDWLTWRLGADEPVTDRGDASGTGYYSPADGTWLPDIAEKALGRPVLTPRLGRPAEVVGHTPGGAALSAGTGDNMGAALGLGVGEGDVVVSIGTSGTAYAVTKVPAADTTGAVAGFADATGRFLPLVATVNAARVLTLTARLLGTDAAGLSELALAAPPGAGGLTLLPYLDGERSPNRPDATGVLNGITSTSLTRENLARAAVEAVLCARSPTGSATSPPAASPRNGWCSSAARPAHRRSGSIAPAVFGVPVIVPEPAEYVALGAARQAAWALSGAAGPPDWPGPAAATLHTAAHVPRTATDTPRCGTTP